MEYKLFIRIIINL